MPDAKTTPGDLPVSAKAKQQERQSTHMPLAGRVAFNSGENPAPGTSQTTSGPNWSRARRDGLWIVFPKRLCPVEQIAYHREAQDEDLLMSRKKWLSLPFYEVNTP